ncbi:MAG: ABC transporter ATP-binding protein [Steroidobacteraceae bacterium]
MSEPLLRVENLCVRYPRPDGSVVRAVEGLDLTLHEREFLGVVGESGSGKSQLLLALLGLNGSAAQLSGSIRYRGSELLGSDARTLNALRGNRISLVFQDPMTALNPYLSIGEQLCEVLRTHRGTSRGAARRRAIAMLDAVQISEAGQRMGQYPHQLSGGMRQRVMIAMALLCEPDILLADEPTTALDVTVQAQILTLLHDLRERLGTAIVLVTHDLGVVAQLADRVSVMYAGRCVEEADVHTLFAAARHPYTRALQASLPRLDAALPERMFSIAGQPPDPAQLPAGCAFQPRCAWADARCACAAPPLTAVSAQHRKACYRDCLEQPA